MGSFRQPHARTAEHKSSFPHPGDHFRAGRDGFDWVRFFKTSPDDGRRLPILFGCQRARCPLQRTDVLRI
jgi:hypothetical protein